jgi:hypothetical protein
LPAAVFFPGGIHGDENSGIRIKWHLPVHQCDRFRSFS